jgi:beta-glucanase (GH16 family)
MQFSMIDSHVIKRLFFAGLFLNSVVISVLAMQKPSNAESFSLAWSTEFDTSLNRNEWNIYNNTPFATSQTACFRGANAYTRRGKLNLIISNNNTTRCLKRPYLSSGLDTHTYQAQTYGKWEVRAKMPAGYGVVGYIGLFPVDGSWPPEVDFAEHIGKEPGNLFLSQHYGTWPNTQQDTLVITDTSVARSGRAAAHYGKSRTCPSQSARSLKQAPRKKTRVSSAMPVNPCKAQMQTLDKARLNRPSGSKTASRSTVNASSYWSNQFHTYTLEWVPGELRYYIDGVLQAKQPQKFTATPNMMKLAIGTGTGDCGAANWIGCPADAAANAKPWPLPAKMQVEYVKIYQYIP